MEDIMNCFGLCRIQMRRNVMSSSESRLETFMSFVEMREYAYGLYDMPLPNIEEDGSIDSAYEALENSEGVRSEGVSSEENDVHVSYSSLYDTAYSEGSSSNIIERPISQTDQKHVSSNTSESSSLNNCMQFNSCQYVDKSKVYDENEKQITADIIRDIVFDKFKDSIDRIEKKKRRKQSIRNINDGQKAAESIDDGKSFQRDIKFRKKDGLNRTKSIWRKISIYSETDSENGSYVKHVGVPDRAFSKSYTVEFTSNTCDPFMKLTQEIKSLSVCDSKNDISVEYAEPFDYENRSVTSCDIKDKTYDEPLIHEIKSICNNKENMKSSRNYLTKDFINSNSSVEVQAFICSVKERYHTGAQSSAHGYSMSSYTNNNSNGSAELASSDNAVERSEYLSTNRPPSFKSQYSNEYNEIDFIQSALDDEIAQDEKENIFRRSVDTDRISYLISSDSTINENRNVRFRTPLSILSNRKYLLSNYFNTSNKRRTRISLSGSYASYEDITNFYQAISSDGNRTEIKNHIYVQESIMEQAERALKFGYTSRKFIGSLAHLEIERILLASNIRKHALTNFLYSLPEVSEAEGKLKIENLKCTTNICNNLEIEQYYMCVLRYRNTVFITNVISPDRLGSINFGGCFIFDDLPNTFNIKMELYAILTPKPSHKCYDIPFWTHTARLPMAQLIGETNIGIMNRKNKRFPLNCLHERIVDSVISASMSTTIKWPETLRGFVTVGISKDEHPTIWNRRWCVLDEGKLTYYYYPSDEDYCKPVGCLTIGYCKSCEESAQKYLWQRTLMLFMEDDHEYKSYFLSPDSSEDFALWQERIQITLTLIEQWKMF